MAVSVVSNFWQKPISIKDLFAVGTNKQKLISNSSTGNNNNKINKINTNSESYNQDATREKRKLELELLDDIDARKKFEHGKY